MIELNSKTQQDFLNREWVQKLLDAGVDMSDAKYWIFENKYKHDGSPFMITDRYRKTITVLTNGKETKVPVTCIPTYTVSELLYKLRNRYGMYTILNCYRNLDIDNVPVIESLASILLQSCKKDTNNE
jgi:hypothetical protein